MVHDQTKMKLAAATAMGQQFGQGIMEQPTPIRMFSYPPEVMRYLMGGYLGGYTPLEQHAFRMGYLGVIEA